MLNEDYKEILHDLSDENVRFILSKKDLEEDGTLFQIGVAPRRIDIITAATGLTFEHTYRNSVLVNIDGIDVRIPSIDDLIINKKATGRTRDLADAEALELIKTTNNGY